MKPSHNQLLSALSIESLNEMQIASIEVNKKHQEVLLLSPTGSGKTLAFLIPVFDQLSTKATQIQTMIIVPSRELALQIESVWKKMKTGFKITCVYGGHDIQTEENLLTEAPAVLIGTPGRILDHMLRGTVKTTHITTLVLDEFDKSLQLGFEEEMNEIIKQLSKVKKRIYTSATEARRTPSFVDLSQVQTLNYIESVNNSIPVYLTQAATENKVNVLYLLLGTIGQESSIVFCNQRNDVEDVCDFLNSSGVIAVPFHGKIEQNYRESALIRFRNGSALVLVTTDLGARGLDIPEVKHVIHYNLPNHEDEFVHRNGRTARMGAGGVVYLLDRKADLPAYIHFSSLKNLNLDQRKSNRPALPLWETIFISAGKKDKVNKVDVVGFLSKKGELGRDELGLVEIKDEFSYAAVKREKVVSVLKLIKDEKLKGRKVKTEIAREQAKQK